MFFPIRKEEARMILTSIAICEIQRIEQSISKKATFEKLFSSYLALDINLYYFLNMFEAKFEVSNKHYNIVILICCKRDQNSIPN